MIKKPKNKNKTKNIFLIFPQNIIHIHIYFIIFKFTNINLFLKRIKKNKKQLKQNIYKKNIYKKKKSIINLSSLSFK